MPEYEVNWHHRLLCKYLQAFAEGTIKKLMVFMPPRHGKLLPANTPVLTTKGWKNHGELNVGDYVFGDDGKPKAVLGNSGVYDWNVERITFDTGITILAAKEHLWKVTINHGDIKIIDTQTIASLIKRGVRVVLNYPYYLREFRKNHLGFKAYSPLGVKSIATEGITKGNCIQVEGGMYLAGHDLIPTHNSELTSRRLPAYLFGIKPDVKIIGCSYNSTLAKDFNRDVQRIIQDPLYNEIFPNTRLNEKNVSTDSRGAYKKNAHEFQIVGQKGYYRGVGVMGPLTGYDMDIGIIDDPVKDAIDAASIVQREAKWEWYTKVFSSRIENHTQQLITQTRWHEDDLSGRIINRLGADDWVIVNLPAIKRGQTMVGDPRQMGEPLWANKKSLEQLLEYEAMDPSGFKALYQQDPQPFEGGLVYNNWSIIEDYEFQQVESSYRLYCLDLGYNNPSACLDLKIDFTNKKVYIDEVLYRTKLNTPQLVENLRANGVTASRELVADSAKPETLSEMSTAFKIIPAVKGPNSVYAGILVCKQYRFYVTRRSVNVISEFGGYQWITDASGNATEAPLKVNDHAMDALRYGVVHADTLFKGRINNERVGFFVNRSRRK